MTLKILVCGDARGNFRLLYEKVSKINKKKGPFDFLLCVGDFFGISPSNWEPFKTGVLKAPLLTYVLGPNSESHLPYYSDLSGCELATNVYYLGKRGILTSSGLKIAYVSGVENSECEDVKITEKDVQTVRDIAYKYKEQLEYVGIDVLLTSQWPKNVTNLVADVDDDVKKASEEGSELLAWLVSEIKPRYHFAGLSDLYFERQPYRNHQMSIVHQTHCTRFIGLSSLTGKKWMYGAGLTPIELMKKSELYQKTSDETESPFQIAKKNSGTDQYFFDMSSKGRSQSSRKRKREYLREECWFCLAGGQDLQTVVSIGTDVYAALPKGGLADRHLIICPVNHLESYLHLSRAVRKEVAAVKQAIFKYFKSKKEVPVFFERYYRTSHMQLNAVPVPESCADKLMRAFASHAVNHKLELVEMPGGVELEEVLRLDTPYLYVELPDGVRFYVKCENNFPLHFAREVLVRKEILNAKHKVDWRECALQMEDEQKLAKQLREEFSRFYSTD